jgi:hypothetical protein
VLGVLFAFAFPTIALSQDMTPEEKAQDLINRQNVWIDHIAWCETQMRDVTILDSNRRYSYGWLQFQMGTWLSFGKSFGASRKNIHDFILQQQVARDMLDKGMENQWYHCSKKIIKTYGSYPLQ